MKRSIAIQYNDGSEDKELEIGKANIVNHSTYDFMFLEKMPDGKWRMTATKDMIDDFSKIDCFKMIRED